MVSYFFKILEKTEEGEEGEAWSPVGRDTCSAIRGQENGKHRNNKHVDVMARCSGNFHPLEVGGEETCWQRRCRALRQQFEKWKKVCKLWGIGEQLIGNLAPVREPYPSLCYEEKTSMNIGKMAK